MFVSILKEREQKRVECQKKRKIEESEEKKKKDKKKNQKTTLYAYKRKREAVSCDGLEFLS